MPSRWRGVADWRIELGERAEPLVALGRGEREMRGRRLRGGNILVLGEEYGFFLGRDMQHMDALAGLARERDQALRAHQRGGRVAPHRVRARVALDAQVHALAQAVFVLGMERRAAADRLEHARTPSSSSISSEPVEEPMNTLTAAGARQPLEFAEVVGVLARGADIEGKVAMHAVVRALDLVGERRGGGGGRIGVGHLEHRGDAAEHRAARAGFQIFLVGQAGLAKMHVAVDHARQHMQARGSRSPQPAEARDSRR